MVLKVRLSGQQRRRRFHVAGHVHCAALNQQLLLAGSVASVEGFPLNDPGASWKRDLQGDGNTVQAVAVGGDWCAVQTADRRLHFFSHMGVQCYVLNTVGNCAALVGAGRHLVTFFHIAATGKCPQATDV
ncbi:hypothetical protein HPB48_016480 [Haemaphysalis longicornis]|uniref:WDHD1/CFT4 second beta-propeller domain-containing protein n=1 Tax=Haemaphysalis longicornis TaxID=44386 RepID=A0A9J6GAT1_HAELO|nr:hypothetical protein HPB48_016480 [Haemaphysalis longicornis]